MEQGLDMSFPPYPPRPSPRKRPARARVARAKAKRMPWGWLEGYILSLTFMQALLFLPGIATIRPVIRISTYAMGFLAWVMVARKGKAGAGISSFPARPWLIFCMCWLMLMLVHPTNYSLKSAIAQCLLYIAVLSPAFWAGAALVSPKQIARLMAVLFLCNALSSLVGIGQVYYPEQFNPPVIPAMNGIFQGEDLKYEAADGRRILRPCGLTDTPGAVAPAGATTALIGLCWALRPIGIFKRLACLSLAFAGVAVIYFTQVRAQMVMLGVCMTTLVGLLLVQGNARRALTLGLGGLGVVAGAFLWVGQTVGSKAAERFGSLLSSESGNLVYQGRGGFVREAFEKTIWEYPLGAGMGWYGMIYAMFLDQTRLSTIWAEIMIQGFLFDGGIPLLVGYMGAIGVALYDSLRISLTTPDRDLRFWAAVIVAQNLGLLANCFSYLTFLSGMGPPFWLFSAALHAADAQIRASERRPEASRTPSAWPRPGGAFAR